MARRTKADKFDIDVEAALEDALDFNFDDDALRSPSIEENAVEQNTSQEKLSHSSSSDHIDGAKTSDQNSHDDELLQELGLESAFEESILDEVDSELFDLESLEQQMALAAEELVAHTNKSESIAEEVVPGQVNEKLMDNDISVSFMDAVADELSNGISLTNDEMAPEVTNVRPVPRVGSLSKSGNSDHSSLAAASIDSDVQDAISSKAPSSTVSAHSNTRDLGRIGLNVASNENGATEIKEIRASKKEEKAKETVANSERSSVFSRPDIDSGSQHTTQNKERREISLASTSMRDASFPAFKGKRKSKLGPVFWSTTALGALWFVGGVATAYKLAADSSLGGFLTSASGLLVTAGTIVPILMFTGFAQLARRARELQDAVEEINIAARRLLEPDVESKERVQSLGSSIRQEVEAMGDGIDRTISRASELEALLQSEVNNLEQAYSENENRIRSLIIELANEREAVSTHAEHVKTTITGAKDQLTREFNSIADHINASAESFTSTLSDTLNMRWGELVDEFNTANEGVAQQLSNKFVETVQSFDASRGRFFEELDTRFAQIDQHTEQASNAVAERLGSKMDDFVKIVHDRTEDVEVRFNSLTGRLANSGEKIIEAVNDSVSDIEKRSDDIDTRLRSTADKVLSDFQNKFDSLDEAIETRGEKSLATFSQQIARLESRAQDLPLTLDNLAVSSVDQFAQQITKVEEQFALLSGRLAKNGTSVTDAISSSLSEIEERSEDIDARIKASTDRLVNEFNDKFSHVDNTINQKTKGSLRQFTDQILDLEKQASELSTSFDTATNLAIQAFEKRLDQVDESLNDRSTSLIRSFIARTEALEESTDKLNVALDTHVGRINDAFQQRTRDIAQTLTGGRDGILSVVEETKVRLSHEMEIVGTTIAKLVDERAGGFIHQFTEGRERLSNTLEKEAAQIVATVSTQLGLLSRHVGEIEEKLLTNIQSVDEKTTSQSEEFLIRSAKFEETISRGFETAREAIEVQSQNLDARSTALNDSLKMNSEALNAVLGEQAGVIEARIAHIRDMIAQGNISFTEALGQHVDLVQSAVLTNDDVLKSTFMAQLERLEDQTSRLKDVFAENHVHLAQAIDERIIGVQETLTKSETAIGDAISSGQEDIKQVLGAGQHALKETLSGHQAMFEDTLSGSQATFNNIMHNGHHALKETLSGNQAVLEDALSQSQANFNNIMHNSQHALKDTLSNGEDILNNLMLNGQSNLKGVIEHSHGVIEETLYNHGNLISQQAIELKNNIGGILETVDERLELQGKKLDQRALSLREVVEHNSALLDKAFETQTAVIDERSATMQNALEIGVTNVRAVLEQNALSLSETLRERISEVSGTLASEAERAENQIARAGDKLNESVLESVFEVERKLQERAVYLKENVADIELQLSNGFSVIENRVSNTAANLSNEAEKAHNIIMSAGQRLSGSVVQAAQNVDEQFNVRDQMLKSNMQEIEGQIHAGLDLISSRMADAAANLTDESRIIEGNIHSGLNLIANRMADASSNLNDEARKIDGQIAVGLDLISHRMASAAANLNEEARKVDNQLSTSIDRIHEKMVDAVGNLTGEAQKIDEQLQNSFSAISSHVSSASSRLQQETFKIDDQLSGGLERINNRMNEVALSLADEADKAENLLANAGERLGGSVVQAAQSVEQKLADRSVFLKENINLIEERVTTGLSSIEGRISEITQKTASQLVNKTQDLHGLTEQLQAAATKTSDSLGMLTNQFSDQLKEVTRAAEERLRSENNTFISNFSNSSDETVSAVKAIKNDISESIAQLLDRLDTSNGTIQQTVNALRNGVYEVDTRLNDVTNEFKQNIGQLSDSFAVTSSNLNSDLERFNGLSRLTLDGVTKFSQQFDDHAKILTEATGLLDRSHDMFNDRLDERQVALASLANGLVQKSEEVSETMQNCEQIIAAIMKRTEERARSSTLQLQSSLSEMVNDASNRFEGATSEIRKSAEEIREELARTRADLSRGVRTLPTQTKEYTEAMRKAVVEQIEALKELSGIVEESGRVFDVSTPAAGAVNQPNLFVSEPRKQSVVQPVRSFAPQEQKAAVLQADLVGAGANDVHVDPLPSIMPSIATTQFTPAPTNTRAPQNTGAVGNNSAVSQVQNAAPLQNSAPLPASYLSGSNPSVVNEPVRSTARNVGSTNYQPQPAFKAAAPAQNVQVQPQAFAPQTQTTQQTANRGLDASSGHQDPRAASAQRSNQSRGWVSDLLARASRDDVDKGATHAPVNTAKPITENAGDTLTSMSADIVQGIDRNAIAELWQYYRRGQRNITPNRLYNANGLKIFEKIKHKYALEGEFRRAVSQYITDFERLLGDVTKNGGNNDTVREYLTSDTGKVYTMLAHASGRIQ
ncbi:hypothetical protein [Bartonella sp. HY038]|uniref:apolipoprotein A-IV repeat region-like domain-containing protein n=1 Tax=Bartonella sp. HY038 TaxID=2759660 RepID=UPI0015FDBE31|nr:hypothetical protein [Bartonella sp. HY038]